MVLEYVYEGGMSDSEYMVVVEYYVKAKQLAMLWVLERYARHKDRELWIAVRDAIELALNGMKELAPYADRLANTLNYVNREMEKFTIEEHDGKIITTITAPDASLQVIIDKNKINANPGDGNEDEDNATARAEAR